MKRLIFIALMALSGCADPAFQQYITARQTAISAMPQGRTRAEAQYVLDMQVLQDKRRQEAQAERVAATIGAAAMAAGAAAGNTYGGCCDEDEVIIIRR